jgi:hypothetical protein
MFKETGREGVDWMHLAQDSDQWRAVVNMCPIKGGEFLDQLSDYQLLKKDSAIYS